MVAAALLAAAVLLPSGAVARALASATVRDSDLLPGVLFFKLLLAFHALLLMLLARAPRPAGMGSNLLAGDGGETASVVPEAGGHEVGGPDRRSAFDGVWTAPGGRAGASTSRTVWLVLGALLVVGAGLRLIALDAGLWHDEIATYILYARRPAGEILALYDSQNQHPLYSLLAHASFGILGDSESALRIPAVLAGVASLAAVYWFARMLVTRTEALLAAALLTASYHHVWFSQNARGYTMLLLLTILGTGCFLRLLSPNAKSGWGISLAYAVLMALAVYTHLSAGFVVGAHAIVWGVLAGRRLLHGERSLDPRPPVAILLATTLSLQLYAIVMPQLLYTLFEKGAGAPGTEWRSPLWLLAETARGLTRGLPGGWLALAAGCVIAAAGVASYARRAPVALALMILPPLAVAVIMLALQHNLWPRLFFFAAAFAVLIVVRGVFASAGLLSARHGHTFAAVALGLAALGSALTVPRAWGPKQDFRGAIAYVERERASEDAVAALGLSDLALIDYLQTGWAHPRTLTELRALESAHARTWAVYTFPTHLASRFPDIEERLRTEYRPVVEFRGTVGGGSIYVLVR